jgi:hypothetical protein
MGQTELHADVALPHVAAIGRECCPPMERLAPSARAGLGLTMSEEGGLDEVEESLRAEARSSRRRVTSADRSSNLACRALSCPCSRRQFAEEVLLALSMPAILSLLPATGSIAVNAHKSGTSHGVRRPPAFDSVMYQGQGPAAIRCSTRKKKKRKNGSG